MTSINANMTITGNLSVSTTLSGSFLTSNGISLLRNTTLVTGISNISCGETISSLCMNDGTVRVCGGRSQYGQLGQNDGTNRYTFVTVLGICSQAIAVANGRYHLVVLMNDGTIRTCGNNNNGQLGTNDNGNRSTPVTVIGICSQAIAVACGRYHTLVLMNDGTVRGIGQNNFGQLGTNDLTNRLTPVPVLGICSQAIAVAGAWYHSAILMKDGTVRITGRNNVGQLGQNTPVASTRSTVVSVLGICSQAIAIACGREDLAIVLNDGTVRTCGRNDFGQLGVNDTVNRSTVVTVIGICSQATAVSMGAQFTAALMNDGTIRICGRNTNGQLAQNDLNQRNVVVPVLGICSQATKIALGFYHTFILLNDGTVRVCGTNEGMLGQNNVDSYSTLVPVLATFNKFKMSFDNRRALALAGGRYDIVILMDDGTVRACGRSDFGQLGQNDTNSRSTVVPILGICSQATAVACSGLYLMVLLNDGTVRGAGRNTFGVLGTNDLAQRNTVVPIPGICSQATKIACGYYHAAFLMNDGTVRCSGRNEFGQLGQNNTSTRSTVVTVLGICSQAIAVAAGAYHTAIVLNDGTVRITGRDNFGQLGQNSPVASTRSTVVSVLGICSQAIAVACGRYHTVILLNDGTVRGTGLNTSGQLGQNDTVNRSTVVPILGICSQAIAVSCGRYYTAILMNDGTVRVCGINNYGQIGVNDGLQRNTVVPVFGICSQAISIGSGFYNMTILMNDGTVRSAGRAAQGQLGLNDLNNRSTVTPVYGIFNPNTLYMNSLALGVTNSTFQLDLSTDGARKLSSSAWFTGSDARIKSDIQTANLDRCSEIIDSLDLKYFEWSPEIKTNDRHSLGWIAQDVEQFFPNSVVTTEAYGIEDFKSLNSDQLIKVMYGALKNMIQKTYPPTEVVDVSNIQGVNSLTSDPTSPASL
jgi:alpha-tubulin suppressor-like RCC1 family protein